MLIVEPIKTSSGYVQPGEIVFATIDGKDRNTHARQRTQRRTIYVGFNENNHAIIQDPHTGKQSFLYLNRMKKI